MIRKLPLLGMVYCIGTLSAQNPINSSGNASVIRNSISTSFSTSTSLPWTKNILFQNDIFIKNEGQWDGWEKTQQPVLYSIDNGFDQFQLTEKGVTAKITHLEKVMEEEEEEEEGKIRTEVYFVSMQWIGSTPKPLVEAINMRPDYFTYLLQNTKSGINKGIKTNGYEKLIYHDLYPGIDVEYTIPEEKKGFKYSLKIHPGADINEARLQYAGDEIENISTDEDGNILIKLPEGEYLREYAPKAWYETTKAAIACKFKLTGNQMQFEFPEGWDTTQTIIIDPWVVNGLANLTTNGFGYDVNYDNQGNLYVYGGLNSAKVAKYDAAGILQWTFNGILITPSWNATNPWFEFGNFITDPQTGKVYIGQGAVNTGTQTIRLATNGVYDNFITIPNGIVRETWDFALDCSNGSLYSLGGGTNSNINMGIINTGTGVVNSSNVTGIGTGCCQDVACGAVDEQGSIYLMFGSSLPAINNHIVKVNSTINGNVWNVFSGYTVMVELDNKKYTGFGWSNSNGFNCLAVNSTYLYYYDGLNLKAFNKTTGAAVGTAITLTGQTVKVQGGIFVDECNNVYIGGIGNISAYNFNGSTFTLLGNIALGAGLSAAHVYDIRYLSSANSLYVSGENFVGTYLASYSNASCYPTLSVTGDCFGNATATVSTTLSTPAITYNWTDASGNLVSNTSATTQLSNTVSGLVPGTYTITAQHNILCAGPIATSTLTIVSCSGLTVQATGQSVCSGACAVVSAIASSGNGPYTYNWSNGSTGQVISVCTTSSSNYTVTVSDSTGASATSIASVTIPTPLSVNATATNVSCNGGNNGTAAANLSGGSSPYTYSWSNNSSQSTISNLSQGTYSVTIRDDLGCSTYTLVVITEPAALSLTTNTATANCNQGSGSATINPSGGSAPYTYLWSNNSTSQQISNLSSATYSATVTDNNGCTIDTAITVGNMPGVTAQLASFISVSCFGLCNGIAGVSGTGGTFPYTYLWSNNQTSASVSGLCATAYTATITDAAGCFSATNITITEPSVLSAPIVALTAINCYGDSTGTINTSPTGGNAPYSFVWSNGSTNQQINNLISGTYSVIVTDNKGCSYTDMIMITEPSPLSYSVTTTNASCNSNNGTATLHVTGGTPGYFYSWSTSGGGGNDTTVTNLGTGTYSVMAQDNNGCSIQTTATIVNTSGLTASIASVSNVGCFVINDGSAIVSATGGTVPYTYLWSSASGGNSTTQQISNLIAGTYTVIVTDNSGCTQLQTVSITQPTVPVAFISGADSICPGDPINLTASGGTTYQWSTGETSASINHQATTHTIYSVTVSNGSCSDTEVMQIIVFPNPAANAGNDTNIRAGQALALSAASTIGNSYQWSNGETTTTINIQPTTTTTYILTVRDANGCISNDTVTVFVDSPCDDNTEVFVPNSFSPNEDGQNDVLQLYSIGIPETIYFAIYNRWGEKVFECADLSSTWDGTYRHKPADTAVFTWLLKITCKDESTENIRTGTVNLMR